MSKKLNRIEELMAKVEKAEIFEKISGNPEIRLEEALIETAELNNIFNVRFKNFKSVHDRNKLPIDLVVREFVTYEIKLVRKIQSKHESKSGARDIHLINRSDDYNQFLENRIQSDLEEINNTFLWNGYQHNQTKSKQELERLYKGLRGVNSGHIAFLSQSVSKSEFVKLFTGGTLSRRVHWDASASLLIILMDFISSKFLDLPEYVQKSLDNDSEKELREWLGGKMMDVFIYGKEGGNEFSRSKITSLRSKLQVLKLKELPSLEGVLNSIVLDD